MAFTEQGVAIVSSVLNSDRNIAVKIQIIRVFTKMVELLATHKDILVKLEQLERKEIGQDEEILLIFEYLKQLEKAKLGELKQLNRRRIGFKQQHKTLLAWTFCPVRKIQILSFFSLLISVFCVRYMKFKRRFTQKGNDPLFTGLYKSTATAFQPKFLPVISSSAGKSYLCGFKSHRNL